MSKRKHLILSFGSALAIFCAALLPQRWKLELGFGYHRLAIPLFGSSFFIDPHTIAHALAFGGAAVLLLSTASGLYRTMVVFGLAGLALATEAAEYFVYRNSFEWRDVLIDLAAIGISGLLVKLTGLSASRPPELPVSPT